MNKLPTKDIQRVEIYFAGEPAAGLLSRYYSAEVNIDPACFDTESDMRERLELVRKAFAELYHMIDGDKPSWVRFDFELDGE